MASSAPRRLRWRLLLLLPIPFCWWLLGHFGALEFAENTSIAWRYHYRGEISAPVKIVYVDIDSRSIEELGNFPWNHELYAKTCAALVGAGQARAVGIDVVMSENGMPNIADRRLWEQGHLDFGRFMWRNPPVVLAASYAASVYRDANGRLLHRQLPILAHGPPAHPDLPELPQWNLGGGRVWTPASVGLIDTIAGGTQWVPLFATTPDGTLYHLALRLALLDWGLGPGAVKIEPDRIEVRRPDGALVRVIPLAEHQLLEVNWFSHWLSPCNPRTSFSVVYNYARALDSEKASDRAVAQEFFAQFKDAIVLIGPVDPLLQDLAATPFDSAPVPRVGIHGNLVKTIVSGRFLWRLPAWLSALILLALTLAMSGLAVAGGTQGMKAKFLALLLAVGYVTLAFQLFKTFNLILPMTAPLGAAFTMSFAAIIWQLRLEEKQKGRIKNMFGTYVSPELVNRMVESGEDPQLGGREEDITAYFSDIQSFSAFSEKLPPARLVELMNEYLTACTDLVQGQGGTLDKYIGDAVVAMYGAPVALPDHAYRACVATQLVHRRMAGLRAKWAAEGDRWPEIVTRMQTRIGLNSGAAVVGNMGSLTRFNYTMMGDNVNLAARMESGAKSYGAYTMVTEATKAAAEKTGDRCVFRFLDRIVVKGRSQPVAIHEIVGLREDTPQAARDGVGLFAQAVEKYLAQDWDAALALFRRSAALEPNQPGKTPGVETNPSLVYAARCALMKEHPPGPGWDGVYVMKTK